MSVWFVTQDKLAISMSKKEYKLCIKFIWSHTLTNIPWKRPWRIDKRTFLCLFSEWDLLVKLQWRSRAAIKKIKLLKIMPLFCFECDYILTISKQFKEQVATKKFDLIRSTFNSQFFVRGKLHDFRNRLSKQGIFSQPIG